MGIDCNIRRWKNGKMEKWLLKVKVDGTIIFLWNLYGSSTFWECNLNLFFNVWRKRKNREIKFCLIEKSMSVRSNEAMHVMVKVKKNWKTHETDGYFQFFFYIWIFFLFVWISFLCVSCSIVGCNTNKNLLFSPSSLFIHICGMRKHLLHMLIILFLAIKWLRNELKGLIFI